MDNQTPDVIRPLSFREGFNLAAGWTAAVAIGGVSFTLFQVGVMPVLATVLGAVAVGTGYYTLKQVFTPESPTPKP